MGSGKKEKLDEFGIPRYARDDGLCPRVQSLSSRGAKRRGIPSSKRPYFFPTSHERRTYSAPPRIWPRTGTFNSGWNHQSEASFALWRAMCVARNSPAGNGTRCEPAVRYVTTQVEPIGEENVSGAT